MTARLLIAAGLNCVVGCTVYSPTVPSTPLIGKGQIEAVVSTRTLLSVDGSVAWSPVNHLLLSGETAFRWGGGNTVVNGIKTPFNDRHRQGSLGFGAYQEFGPARALYVAAVGGVGVAAVNVHNGLIGGLSEYTATYNRYYGQVYLAQRGHFFSGGVSMRITWLSFSQLLLDNMPVAPIARLYFEPSIFVRAGRGALQSQLVAGISVPDRTNATYGTNNLAAQSSLVSVGLVFQPSLLKKHADAAP